MLVGNEHIEPDHSVIDSPHRMLIAYSNRLEARSANPHSGQDDRSRRVGTAAAAHANLYDNSKNPLKLKFIPCITSPTEIMEFGKTGKPSRGKSRLKHRLFCGGVRNGCPLAPDSIAQETRTQCV